MCAHPLRKAVSAPKTLENSKHTHTHMHWAIARVNQPMYCVLEKSVYSKRGVVKWWSSSAGKLNALDFVRRFAPNNNNQSNNNDNRK